jgi:hypothetical protein
MADQAQLDEHCAAVMRVLESEGEVEKIQSLIGKLVFESNWRDEVRKLASRRMDQENIEDLTPEAVTEMIMAEAIDLLPPSVQSQVCRHIREFLTKKKVPAEVGSPKAK